MLVQHLNINFKKVLKTIKRLSFYLTAVLISSSSLKDLIYNFEQLTQIFRLAESLPIWNIFNNPLSLVHLNKIK